MKPEVAAPPELQVMWPRELLNAPPEVAAQAFARSLHGYAKRLDPEKAKRFLMAADTPINDAIDDSIVNAYGGVHPKHWVTDYHGFFCDRISPGERVLDLGCGVSMVALSIIQRSKAAVTGVDWSDHNLAMAAKLAAGRGLSSSLTLVRGDICHTRVPGSFDTIVLSNVLEHITERPARLRQWAQWYHPKRILIRVPAFDRDWRVPLKKELGLDWRCDQTHETEYTRPQVEEEMRAANLTIREIIVRWSEYWVHAEPA
jgi:2-polyprenyl-3-methyl-5-hydroxy-6-metoxy-1,4-benzoquinol methylase